MFQSDDQCWQALLQRERQAVGHFFYGVTTTQIFCQPACPSRLPKRDHVQFFTTLSEAVQAGYRACQRCRPGEVASSHPAVHQACRLIDEATEPPKLSDLARAVGLSPAHLHRVFSQQIGVSPKSYAAAQRVERLQNQLLAGSSVTTAIYSAGFNSSSRCYEKSGSVLGMTPSQFQKRAQGITITYGLAPVYLGWLLVAATSRGVCLIALADTPESLKARLQERFPQAQLRADAPEFQAWLEPVLALIEQAKPAPDLPLDIQGTAFQQRVWQALQAIPLGKTATYSEIAQQLGQPTAARAVARACATNDLAVAIPCHRVIGRDGSLSGYRWGIERKRALLEREQQVLNGERDSVDLLPE